MKFTDGYWLIREGFKPHFATELVGSSCEQNGLRLVVATRRINHRGDTLQGPLLTIRLSSPADDIVRIQISHFEGKPKAGPDFELTTDSGYVPELDHSEASTRIKTGSLCAEVSTQNGWNLRFAADGRTLTSSTGRSIGYIQSDDGKAFVHEQLQLDVGELVYGLGERFTPYVKNGQVVETWNEDGGTGSEQAYKNIPFYFTSNGYGVFVNQPDRVSFEVASEKVSKVQFSVEGESLDYFLIYGPTPKEILQKYTWLTGRPALPPPWSFGLWLTTSFTTNYDEATITEFIDGMAQRDLPLHVFHFDCFWMRQFRWCDFEWDPAVFPDPVGMLQRLKAKGLKVCVWINPYIAQESALFAEGVAGGYFLRRPNGSVWQWDMWQPGMAIVDFTNPSAVEWYQSKLKRLLDMGVDAFKTDFGERIPTDCVYFDGSDPRRAHNFYPYLYNKAVFELLEQERGEGEATLFARSACVGGQKYPVHWGGDCYSDYPSMAESLRGGLSLACSGFGFWSHDIGGFEGMPPADLYKRWIAFGLLSSHSRLHGSSSYRVPWLFDEESCVVLQTFTKLKCSLMPYLYQAAAMAHQSGIPVMRPMVVEFPDDLTCRTLDRQYMLGESLLFAPVFSRDGSVDVYLPAGRWTNWFTGATFEGEKWRKIQVAYDQAALFVRPGSIVALGKIDELPDYDYTTGTCFKVFQLEPGAVSSSVIPNHDGTEAARLSVTRTEGEYAFELSGNLDRPQVVLVNQSLGANHSAILESSNIGADTVITPKKGAKRFSITVNSSA